ncbi:Gfo/Idh/MocA family oxidoreductase [candidate division KSB1 bacterium]|nr:Gfo/Idh/MocA family oxidoreductase [candidate division KSB1 bacterium]
MEEKIRIGIIGVGGIAQMAHIPVLKGLDGVEIVAVCDIDSRKAGWIAEKFHIPRFFVDLEKMLKLEEMYAVHICTPNSLHMPMTIAALSADKHVLVEKPVARNPDETQKMADEARKRGKKVMVAMNHRFRPDSAVLKEFIERGELGRVFYIRSGWLKKRGKWLDEGGWLCDPRVAGGGVLMDLGTQMLDLSLWLVGNPKVTSVLANTYNHFRIGEVEDTVVAMLKLEDGGLILLEVSWTFFEESTLAFENLLGDQGSATLNPLKIYKNLHGNLVTVSPTMKMSPLELYQKSFELEITHFMECLRNDTVPISNLDEGLKVMRLIESIYQSAQDNREIIL